MHPNPHTNPHSASPQPQAQSQTAATDAPVVDDRQQNPPAPNNPNASNPSYPMNYMMQGPPSMPYPPSMYGAPGFRQMPPPQFISPMLVPMAVPGASSTVPPAPNATGYFGNLATDVADDAFSAILGTCGVIRSFKRPLDPSTRQPKHFALVEFESFEGLLRAHRLLQGFPLNGRSMAIKVEEDSSAAAAGEDAMTAAEAGLSVWQAVSKVLIGKKLTASPGTMDWLERKISDEKRRQKEHERELEKEKGRASLTKEDQDGERIIRTARNYDDLIEFSSSNGPSKTRSKHSSLMASASDESLRDHERRNQTKMKDLERELRREQERETERENRHLQDVQELQRAMQEHAERAVKYCFEGKLSTSSSLMTVDSEISFFKNREKWREGRRKALQKEAEIFEECEKILQALKTVDVPPERPSLIVDLSEFQGKHCDLRPEEFAKKLRETQCHLLLSKIPASRQEILNFPVDWKYYSPMEDAGFVSEKISSFFLGKNEAGDALHSNSISHLVDFLLSSLNSNPSDPIQIINILQREPAFLAASEDAAEAEFLVILLWRWLIFITEARAHGIQ